MHLHNLVRRRLPLMKPAPKSSDAAVVRRTRHSSIFVALLLWAAASALVLMNSALGAPAESESMLKVCSDANNLPLSNDRGEGYENKLAERLAQHLKRKVQYTWFPQRMG